VLLGSCLLLFLLGASPWGLWERDEGRYADVAREMLERRDFVTPRIDGAVFLDKPPLVYWVTAASLALWGRGETGARFGQILFAAGVLLVTRRIGVLLSGRRRGNIALIVLASSLLFFAASHILTLDMGLAFFVALALLFFLKGYRAGPHGGPAYLAMFAAAAAAVLTKGPIGAVLPALTVTCFLIPRREWPRVREIPWVRGILLFVSIVAPWFVAMSIANPEFPRYFFLHEHLERFATTVHRHPGKWWYYLAVLAAGLMPWSLMLPAHLVRFRSRLTDVSVILDREAPAFLWSWLAPGFLLFTLSQSKLALYVLPLIPAAALLLASMLERDLHETTHRSLFLWPSSFLVVVAAGAGVLWHRRNEWGLIERAGVGRPLLLFVAVLAGGAILLGYLVARRGRAVAALLTTAFLWMAACYAVFTVVGRVDFFNETKHFATVLRLERTAGEPVYAYQCYLRGLPFYLNETVGLVSPHSDDLKLGRITRHDPGTFPDESMFFDSLQKDARVFVVLRHRDLQLVQRRAARPLYILARSELHALVSNRLGERRERDLRSILDAAGPDLDSALARALRMVPGADLTMIAIGRRAEEPTCSLHVDRDGAAYEVSFPMARPARVTVAQDDQVGAEARGEEHLIRLAPPPLSVAQLGRLLRLSVGG